MSGISVGSSHSFSSASEFSSPSSSRRKKKRGHRRVNSNESAKRKKVLLSSSCVGIVGEDGRSVLIFDAAGIPRTFVHDTAMAATCTPTDNGNRQLQKLCFSTHSSLNVADDLLTPCFDEFGLHGVPEESCFCGIDRPHIHAHVHDPKTCDNDDDMDKQVGGGSKNGRVGVEAGSLGSGPGVTSVEVDKNPRTTTRQQSITSSASRSLEDQISYLATQVLLPLDDDMEDRPPECSISVLERNDSSGGIEVAQGVMVPKRRFVLKTDDHPDDGVVIMGTDQGNPFGLRNRRDVNGFAGCNIGKGSNHKRRYKIQHDDDHVDFLVHDLAKDTLHLSRTGKDGNVVDDDLRRRFRLMGKRRLKRSQGSNLNANASATTTTQPLEVSFYEIVQQPFSFFAYVRDFVDVNTDRVLAVDNIIGACCHSSSSSSSSYTPVAVPPHENRDVSMSPPSSPSPNTTMIETPDITSTFQLSRNLSFRGSCKTINPDRPTTPPPPSFYSWSRKANGGGLISTVKNNLTQAKHNRHQHHHQQRRSRNDPYYHDSSGSSKARSILSSSTTSSRSGMEHLHKTPREQNHYRQTEARPWSSSSGIVMDRERQTQSHQHSQNDHASEAEDLCDEGHCHSHAHGHCHGHGHDGHGHDHGVLDRTTVKAAATTTTTIACKGICCSSEVPAIEDIVEQLPGVRKVIVNVPLKYVIVDHDPKETTADGIAEALNEEDLGATVLRADDHDHHHNHHRHCHDHDHNHGHHHSHDHNDNENKPEDAGSEWAADGGNAIGAIGRSQLHVKEICCASEIPIINSIVQPMNGVIGVKVNPTTKVVYVDHDTKIVTAAGIANRLNEERMGATVKIDGGLSLRDLIIKSTVVESTIAVEKIESDPDSSKALTNYLNTLSNDGSTTIESYRVDVGAGTVTVVHNPLCMSTNNVVEEIRKNTGMSGRVVRVDGDEEFKTMWDSMKQKQQQEQQRRSKTDRDVDVPREKFSYPRPTVRLSGLFWIASMLSFIGGAWEILKYLGLISVAFGILPIALKAFKTLRRFQFDANCLTFFASVGAVALQEYTEAAAVVFLFAASEWLEVRATTRARHALSAIVQLRPDCANLMNPSTKELLVVPAGSVPVGALVSVKTGDKIPCDGIVVEGRSTVDESSLTGESRPISKGPDDTVSGGTVNSGMSPFVIRTISTADDSAVSKLIRLVEEAQANRSETEKLLDRFARVYTPIIVAAALLMCSIPWAFGRELGAEWTYNGLILIVVACPCALIISTPVTYVAGLAATAQRGVLVRGGANLEALGRVKYICFDKTGTLTNGEFSLLHLRVVGREFTREKVLQYLSIMEQQASHPVAQAIVAAAQNESVAVPADMVLSDHEILPGQGVVGIVDGKKVCVGNDRLFQRLGLLKDLSTKVIDDVQAWKSHLGGTVGYMSVEGYGIVCAFCAADGVRDESRAVVNQLRKMGMKMTMLTGDNREAAHAIGSQVGLSEDTEIKYKLLPEEKLHYVQAISSHNEKMAICRPGGGKKETVLFCGDGVNDALALTAANVGVAMGAGAALAMETADVTLLDSNLEKLVYSIRMGRRVIRKIKQNVVFSLSVKFIVLEFALFGKTSLWAAIISDVGAMILVTLNAMMLLPARQRRSEMDELRGDIERGNSKGDAGGSMFAVLSGKKRKGKSGSNGSTSSSSGEAVDEAHKASIVSTCMSSGGNGEDDKHKEDARRGRDHHHDHGGEHEDECSSKKSSVTSTSTNLKQAKGGCEKDGCGCGIHDVKMKRNTSKRNS